MRKVASKAPKPAPVKVIETYRIQAKFASDVFFPSNAVEERFWKRDWNVNADIRFQTMDGKICVPKFISTTNNKDGWADERFDDFCQRMFNISFRQMRSLWFGRLGKLDYYWHWVKLTVVE